MFKTRRKKEKSRGQGFVELAIMFPILIMLLSGLIEFGFMFGAQLAISSSVRNAARFGSDGEYNIVDSDKVCKTTRDYFRQIGCIVNQELRQSKPFMYLNDNGTPSIPTDDYVDPILGSDIIISVFTVDNGNPPVVSQRFPSSQGWSYASDLDSYGVRNHSSRFSTNDVETSLDNLAPSTGFLLVEVFYTYRQMLRLPWLTAFVPEYVTLYSYIFMPLSSAEPTPTFIPVP